MGKSRVQHREFMVKYMSGLVGRKIVEAGVGEDLEDEPGSGGFPFFVLDDGKRIEVSQDEEGNGPGFLFGLEVPK